MNRVPTSMRRRPGLASLALALTFTLTLLLAACAGLVGPRTLRLSEADLMQQLARHFPYEQRVLEILDVRLGAPRLTLLPEANRLANEIPLELTERLLGRRYRGALSLDYQLRYDERDQAVRLDQVHVGRLTLDELPTALKPLVDRLGPLLAERLLEDVVVYRIKPEDLKRAQGLGYRPGQLTVTRQGVEMVLNPER